MFDNLIFTVLRKLVNKQPLPSTTQPLQLTASANGQPKKDEKTNAAHFLRLIVRPGRNSEALLVNINTLTQQGISHLSYDYFDETDYQLALQDAFLDRGYANVTFYVRRAPIDLETLVGNLDTQLEPLASDDPIAEYIREYKGWSIGTGRFAYELLVVTDAEYMASHNGELTAALNGQMVSYMQLGPFLRDWLLDLPVTWENQLKDRDRKALKPLDYAMPRSLWWYTTYWVNVDAQKAYAAWTGNLQASNVNEVMNVADNVVFTTEIMQNDDLFGSATVLASVPWHEGVVPDFSEVGRTLTKKGFSRVNGKARLKQIFASSTPGAAPFGKTKWIEEPNIVLDRLAKQLTPYSEDGGNLALGLIRGVTPAIVEVLDTKVTAVQLGKTTEAGKSTLASMLAVAAGIIANRDANIPNATAPNVVWLPFSSERKSAVPEWVRHFGGHVHTLDLPEAYQVIRGEQEESTTLIQPADVQALQLELHQKDMQDAHDLADRIYDESIKIGRPAMMPFTFDGTINVRALSFMGHFLERFEKVWEELWLKWNVLSLVNGSDFSPLKLTDRDTNLGDLPFKVGYNLGLQFVTGVPNWRNKGRMTWTQTHAVSDFDWISPNVYSTFNLAMHMRRKENGQRIAKVVIPSENPGKEPDVILFPEIVVDLDPKGYLFKTFASKKVTASAV